MHIVYFFACETRAYGDVIQQMLKMPLFIKIHLPILEKSVHGHFLANLIFWVKPGIN